MRREQVTALLVGELDRQLLVQLGHVAPGTRVAKDSSVPCWPLSTEDAELRAPSRRLRGRSSSKALSPPSAPGQAEGVSRRAASPGDLVAVHVHDS